MDYIDIDAFYRDGYAVVRVLETAEVEKYRAIADDFVAAGAGGRDDFMQVSQLPQVLGHPVIQGAVGQILGGTDLVLDTWGLLQVGDESYHQGWHRDIPLGAPWLPAAATDPLLEAIAQGRWFHNNVQCNLALNRDTCYWIVPGSNCRAFTVDEEAVFGPIFAAGDHSASRPDETDAGITGGVSVAIEPGEMILQNNVGIHRGWGAADNRPRRTLHFGFHNGQRPPTWHFRRALNDHWDQLSPEQRQRVDSVLGSMLARRAQRMEGLNPSEPGDTAWRIANLELFFGGGLAS
ncbi:MAG: hypothetical protein GKR89_05125 [Candidatus Latescibacteria bacterium]|nr:hypothetical protein [Candidatus Latescibacterota bacterium]